MAYFAGLDVSVKETNVCILCHALLAAPLHLTRCRKTFFTADYLYQIPLIRTRGPIGAVRWT